MTGETNYLIMQKAFIHMWNLNPKRQVDHKGINWAIEDFFALVNCSGYNGPVELVREFWIKYG